jgi:putative flippase GtrA
MRMPKKCRRLQAKEGMKAIMFEKIWKKLVNYETVSYIICGFLTTAVDFVTYGLLREAQLGVGVSQALSWVAAVLFAYVVNKLIVFRNFNLRPAYLVKEAGSFVAARAFSGVATWILMVVMVWLGGNRGIVFEMICKLTSSLVNMVLNYIFSKLWIFKDRPEKGE